MTKIGLGSQPFGHRPQHGRGRWPSASIGFDHPSLVHAGGTGGGIAYNTEEFETICKAVLGSLAHQKLLIEESLLGWKEYEMEVVRDKADNCIIICSIENLDPMGVHTGDSITVARRRP